MSPRFRVKEIRARNSTYLIDARTEDDATHGRGEFIDFGGDADDYGLELVSVEEVSDDEEEA